MDHFQIIFEFSALLRNLCSSSMNVSNRLQFIYFHFRNVLLTGIFDMKEDSGMI